MNTEIAMSQQNQPRPIEGSDSPGWPYKPGGAHAGGCKSRTVSGLKAPYRIPNTHHFCKDDVIGKRVNPRRGMSAARPFVNFELGRMALGCRELGLSTSRPTTARRGTPPYAGRPARSVKGRYAWTATDGAKTDVSTKTTPDTVLVAAGVTDGGLSQSARDSLCAPAAMGWAAKRRTSYLKRGPGDGKARAGSGSSALDLPPTVPSGEAAKRERMLTNAVSAARDGKQTSRETGRRGSGRPSPSKSFVRERNGKH